MHQQILFAAGTALVAHQSVNPVLDARRVVASPVMAVAATPLIDILEQRDFGSLVQRVRQEPGAIVSLFKDAGIYGVFAYILAAGLFYGTAVPIAEVVYHSASGQWFDPRVLLQDDGAEKVEALALLASFYLFCKPFAPVRLGGALLLTADVRRFVEARPALSRALDAAVDAIEPATSFVGGLGDSIFQAIAPRTALKGELLELAEKSDRGITPLPADEQARFDELLLEKLPALCPLGEPTRSELFSGEWECRWTDEKEINFAVRNGLLGLPWVRTYQQIDIAAGTLVNVLEFEEGGESGELRVGSSIAPDEADGAKFDFQFDECALRYKSLTVPLPPVGKGWGELLYLDGDMRIQRDVRGDVLVATKVLL